MAKMRSTRETSGIRLEKSTASMKTPKGGRGQGMSAAQNTSVGSGSRPTKSRFTIGSTAPSNAQMIRPKNTIGS